MESRYSKFGSDGSNSQDNDDEIQVKYRPEATISGFVDRVFGSESEFGQSLGTVFADVKLIDGALYVDPEKEKYKIFSWSEIGGLSPEEKYERDQEVSIDDAPDVETRTYFGDQKTYELVAARIEERMDDGEVGIESQAKHRSVDLSGDHPEFGDWEYQDAPVELPDALTWWNANQETGPSVSAQSMAETLSYEGEDAVLDTDDYMNWLKDTSGDNILRNDLKGRRVEFFLDTKTGESGYNYHPAVIIDAETGARIGPKNSGGSGNANSQQEQSGQSETESETITAAKELDAGSVPDPVADFINTGERLSMDEERAAKMLDELVGSGENAMTESMVEEAGGREALIGRVIEQ